MVDAEAAPALALCRLEALEEVEEADGCGCAFRWQIRDLTQFFMFLLVLVRDSYEAEGCNNTREGVLRPHDKPRNHIPFSSSHPAALFGVKMPDFAPEGL